MRTSIDRSGRKGSPTSRPDVAGRRRGPSWSSPSELHRRTSSSATSRSSTTPDAYALAARSLTNEGLLGQVVHLRHPDVRLPAVPGGGLQARGHRPRRRQQRPRSSCQWPAYVGSAWLAASALLRATAGDCSHLRGCSRANPLLVVVHGPGLHGEPSAWPASCSPPRRWPEPGAPTAGHRGSHGWSPVRSPAGTAWPCALETCSFPSATRSRRPRAPRADPDRSPRSAR